MGGARGWVFYCGRGLVESGELGFARLGAPTLIRPRRGRGLEDASNFSTFLGPSCLIPQLHNLYLFFLSLPILWGTSMA